MLNLNIIIGSTRPGRAADHVAPWIAGLAKEHPAFTVEVLDLRDWPLPFFAETYQTIGDPQHPAYSDPIVRRWNQRIAEGDAYLFITPEYNHSVPGVLKNAIDSVFASLPSATSRRPSSATAAASPPGSGLSSTSPTSPSRRRWSRCAAPC